jgi:mRNA-degrading endonuclease toxin of MazEF toxin-antitoxin module
VVIVSDDRYNLSALGTVTVVAATRTTALAGMPGKRPRSGRVGGLDEDSVIKVTQVATIDRRRSRGGSGRCRTG